MSFAQIAEGFFRGDPTNARRGLKRIAHLVEPFDALARPPPILTEPLIAWMPGEPEPTNFDSVSYQLHKRWKSKTAERLTVYIATRQALKLYGGKIKVKAEHVSHDLGMAAVYLHYLRRHPKEAELWRGEDVMKPTLGSDDDVRPDAHIIGSTRKLLDYGGNYATTRLRELWSLAEWLQQEIEIW